MQPIKLPNQLFVKAERRAAASGVSVEMFVAEAVQHYLGLGLDDYDRLFTPEVIAHLDGIGADLDAGEPTYTSGEVDEFLAANRIEWLANHPG